MKIGVYGGNVRRGEALTSLVHEVSQMEERGFASYWFSQVDTYDALTVIALAGQQTATIELGVGVVPTYPRHPYALAQQAATANVLAGGRLTLGVGPSHRTGIEDNLGLRYTSPAWHTREYATILKKLASEGQVKFDGEHFAINAALSVPEAQPFDVVISALAPLMLKTAGEVADGTVTWMVGRNTIRSHTVPRITEAARNAGRDTPPRIIVGLPVCVHDDTQEAVERSLQMFKGYEQLPNYRRQLDAEGLNQAGKIAVVGNEQQVTEQLRGFLDAGATEVIASVFPAGNDRRGSFQRTYELLQGLASED
jgi:F420-dependent oxidoreductase-like protein